MATQTSTDFNTNIPRAVHIGTNRMEGSAIMAAPLSSSASDEIFMFALPPKCLVVSGGIKMSVPSSTSGNVVVKLGTRESDSAFGTVTVSGTAVTSSKLTFVAAVTVSTSDDVQPYQRAVLGTVNSAATSTTSLSIYLTLEYVMPGNISGTFKL